MFKPQTERATDSTSSESLQTVTSQFYGGSTINDGVKNVVWH